LKTEYHKFFLSARGMSTKLAVNDMQLYICVEVQADLWCSWNGPCFSWQIVVISQLSQPYLLTCPPGGRFVRHFVSPKTLLRFRPGLHLAYTQRRKVE